MGEVRAAPLAVVEVLDRDGQVRQTMPVHAWPLRVGRALDNDLLLADPHVAAHHLAFEPDAAGALQLVVGETGNGVHWGRETLARGTRRAVPAEGSALELGLGRTRLLLRLPGHALAPELPLAAAPTVRRRVGPTLAVAATVLLLLAFSTWLDSDPDTFVRSLGSLLMSTLVGVAVWCGAWSLLSKIFARAGRFGWHLLVLMSAALTWTVLDTALPLLAFSLSWPWITDFAFVAGYAVAAGALYFHLLAVEPQRPRVLRGVAVVAFVTGIGLSLWFNHQRNDRYGAELYMSHLFPPALRLARPVPADRFVDGLQSLQPLLDQRAKEPPRGDGGNGGSDDE